MITKDVLSIVVISLILSSSISYYAKSAKINITKENTQSLQNILQIGITTRKETIILFGEPDLINKKIISPDGTKNNYSEFESMKWKKSKTKFLLFDDERTELVIFFNDADKVVDFSINVIN